MSNKHPRTLIGIFVLLAGLALSGCSKPEDAIIGTWKVDVDATVAGDEKLKAMPEDQRKMAMDMAKGLFKEASFEFTKDGKMVANFAGKKEEGSFTVKSAEGGKVVLSTKGKDGKEEDVTVEAKDGKMILSTKGQNLYLMK